MKKYLLLSFTLICLMFLGFDLWSSYRYISKLFQTMEQRRQALGELHQFEFYLSMLKDAETGQRGFTITGDSEYLEPYENAIKYFNSDEYKKFIAKWESSSDSQQREKIKRMKEIEKKKLEEMAIVIQKRKELGFEHAKNKEMDHKGKRHMNDLRDIGSSLIADKKRIIQETDRTIEEHTHITLLSFILGDIVSSTLIGLCLWYLYSYIKQLEKKDSKLSLMTQQLSDSLAARQSILNAADYAIIATNTEGIITNFNPAAERMFGYSHDELIGQQTPLILHDTREIEARGVALSNQFQIREKLSLAGVFISLAKYFVVDTSEWTFIRKDGTHFPGLLSFTSIKNEEGHLIGYMGIIYDITERKEIDHMKNELIAITSHELRSPVASIKGTLDLLSQQESGVSDQTKRILEIGKKNCGRLARIVDDLIDLQQIQLGNFNLNFRKMNFSVFLSKVIQANTQLAQQSDVEIRCPMVPKDWFIEADESRMMQVMNKLLLNAINYSRNKKSIIDISVSKIHDKIRVEIKNECLEISKEFLEKVFQPFARNPSIDSAEKKGSGLELNLAKSIIEKHRGILGFKTLFNEMILWFELSMFESIEK